MQSGRPAELVRALDFVGTEVNPDQRSGCSAEAEDQRDDEKFEA